MKKKVSNTYQSMTKAFTLAEVLITLTILGVIAAVTIPGIIRHYKKLYVETKIKQAYSIFENVVEEAKAVYNQSADQMLNEALDQGTANHANHIYFMRKYVEPFVDYVKEYPIKGDDGIYWTEAELILKNGMHVGIQQSQYRPPSYASVTFHFDINGQNKGPNKVGADRFSLTLFADSRGFKTLVPARADIFSMRGEDKTTVQEWCTENELDGACTELIRRNGWKIPDDYPVKL